MKISKHPFVGAILASALITFASTASAQTTVTETVTTQNPAPVAVETQRTETVTTTNAPGEATIIRGSVTEYTPTSNSVIIRSASNPEPVRYSVTKETTVVNQAGEPMTIDTLRSGLPAEVHYHRVGDQIVASRIVVNSSSTTTTTAPAAVAPSTTVITTPAPSRPLTEDQKEELEEKREERAERRAERREKAREAAED